MAQNTDEEHLDIPTNTQAKNSLGETITAVETETIKSKQEPKHMEVHHHPHVEKKSIKEYILEGLMIFIAVSMGFAAESLRENINKHEKEHHLMELLVQDLKKDIITLDSIQKRSRIKLAYMDTLRRSVFAAIDKELSDSEYKNIYYIEARFGKSALPLRFVPIDRALSQLEKTDAYNFISKQNVSDSILNYKGSNTVLIDQYQIIREYYQLKAHEVALQIFKGSLINDIIFEPNGSSGILKSNRKFTLLTRDKYVLEVYGSRLIDLKSFFYNYAINIVPAHKKKAERLINLIQKEYSLED